ncbi:MAG: hypothetical protein K0R18_1015 [Bacillales bacterium]|jgi:hypothetical protein|nr:hypothetical protein [Bacillales bacterium]
MSEKKGYGRGYNLNSAPNEGVKDNAPDWMDDLFTKLSNPRTQKKKEHPFAGIDDPILNPQRIGLEDKK